jgi:hypothetical protein
MPTKLLLWPFIGPCLEAERHWAESYVNGASHSTAQGVESWVLVLGQVQIS